MHRGVADEAQGSGIAVHEAMLGLHLIHSGAQQRHLARVFGQCRDGGLVPEKLFGQAGQVLLGQGQKGVGRSRGRLYWVGVSDR